MEQKINIAELLKDCPKGMELDCVLYEDVTFECILDGRSYPIQVQTPEGKMTLSKYGCLSLSKHTKCVIFPKGKTTWEGFVPPCNFKDGDIVTCTNNACTYTAIFKEMIGKGAFCHYGVVVDNKFRCRVNDWSDFNETCRFATEEEKQKLFQAIKDNGYVWNPKTKDLVKLPKFKVGDTIKNKNDKWLATRTIQSYVVGIGYFTTINDWVRIEDQDDWELVPDIKPKFKFGDRIIKRDSIVNSWIVSSVSSEYYGLQLPKGDGIGVLSIVEQDDYELISDIEPKFKKGDKIKHKENTEWVCTIRRVEDRYYVDGHPTSYTILFDKQDEYELVPNKFDINTLKPFDKVLVRVDNSYWRIQFFEKINKKNKNYAFGCMNGNNYKQCIPYEGNEHLLSKTDDCDEFYKTWK